MDGNSFRQAYLHNSKEAIAALYRSERGNFMTFAARWNLPEEELADIFQDAMVAFIENLRKGKIELKHCTPSTYLFSIGKYMIFKRLKSKNILMAEAADLPEELVWEENSAVQIESQYKKIVLALEKMGEQCRKILTLFYYDGRDLDEIMGILKYDKKEVLKSQKSRCLKQLREKCNTMEL
jgi:RNA polymerase sigma factor (sigma-70 family)